MATRSKETTLTFSKAFALSEVDRPLPAGTYRVVVDEEDIPGLSFSPSGEPRQCCTFRRCLRLADQRRCFSSTRMSSPRPSKPIALRHETRRHSSELSDAIGRLECHKTNNCKSP